MEKIINDRIKRIANNVIDSKIDIMNLSLNDMVDVLEYLYDEINVLDKKINLKRISNNFLIEQLENIQNNMTYTTNEE